MKEMNHNIISGVTGSIGVFISTDIDRLVCTRQHISVIATSNTAEFPVPFIFAPLSNNNCWKAVNFK